MNKFISKIVGVGLGLALATGVGAGVVLGNKNISKADAAGTTATWAISSTNKLATDVQSGTFTDSENHTWSWTSNKNPGSLQNSNTCQQIGANGNPATVTFSSSGFTDTVTKVAVVCASYQAKHNISITVGGDIYLASTATPQWTTTAEKSGTGTSSGEIVISFTPGGSARAMYIQSISVTHENSSAPTIVSLETFPEDDETVNLDAEGASSVQSTLMYEVGYSDDSSDYSATISGSPSAGFAHQEDGNGNSTLTFTQNGTYEVTVTADSSHTSTITYVVTGIPVLEYELYNGSSIATGDYVFMSADANYTYVMGNTTTNDRVANGTAPTVSNSKITNPSSAYVWHLSKSGDYWTIQNSATGKYLAGTTTKNQAALLDDASSDLAKWTITNSNGWIFENYGRTSQTNPENRYLRNNTTSGWACYTSSQGNGVALFKLPSNNPAITVTLAGETTLGVGETATLTATKINGATGTIAWSVDANATLGTPTVSGDSSSVVVTGSSAGTAVVTASLTGCDDVATTFKINNGSEARPYTVAEAKAAIDANYNITDVYTSGIIAQIDSYSSQYSSITYWISDDGTTTNMLQVYGGLGLNGDGFSSIDDIEIGATVTVYGTLKKYSQTYEYDKNNYLTSYSAPDYVLSAITGIEGTLSAVSGDSSWNLSGLTPKGSFSNGQTNRDISAYVDLTTEDVPGTVSVETQKTVRVTVTPKDQTLASLAQTFNVSGTVRVVSGPLSNGGRYYIMNSDKTYGLSAEISSSASPNALDLSVANNGLTAFDVRLTDTNSYEISTTVSGTKYYLVCNTVDATGSNSSIRITSSPLNSLVSRSWVLDDSEVETDGAYHVKENTYSSTYRYLAYYTDNATKWDWRGYVNTNNGNPEIQFVAEGSYAETIANSLLNDLTCNNGVTAPSTTVWSNISTAYSNVTIAHEKALLTDGTANESSTNVIEKALAKYDYVVGKYNKGLGNTAYNDFLSRDPDIPSSTNGRLNVFGSNSQNALVIVVITAFVTMTFVGGYFFLRKKKEN